MYENRNDIPFTVSFAKTVAVIDIGSHEVSVDFDKNQETVN
jgi:hypothetical protein